MSGFIKKEDIEGEYEPEGFIERTPASIPQGFSATEWEELTKVFITCYYNSVF